ncbi:MAG TPA: hypothetical protein VIL85_15805 [Thermomicrobiales bacterium]|jgi:hypothetical protein
MADMTLLLESWGQQKATDPRYYRLTENQTQKFVFQGRQWGHPSNFAAVTFDCMPAESLSLTCNAIWPPSLDTQYCRLLEQAIGYGLIEALLAKTFYPYRGCALTLTAIEWDDVMSSEVAFYRASKGAMDKLIAEATWHLL